MKLAILSRSPAAYSTQRLRAAALERGHEVRVLNTLRFAIDLSGDEPDLQYRGKPLPDNPKTSTLAAHSVVAEIRRRAAPVEIGG